MSRRLSWQLPCHVALVFCLAALLGSLKCCGHTGSQHHRVVIECLADVINTWCPAGLETRGAW
jgi:hypothetical protein